MNIYVPTTSHSIRQSKFGHDLSEWWFCALNQTERNGAQRVHNIIALRKRTRCTAAVLLRIVLKHANRYRFCLGIGPDNVLLRTSCPYITPQCTAANPQCSEIAFIIFFVFIVVIIPVCIRQQIPDYLVFFSHHNSLGPLSSDQPISGWPSACWSLDCSASSSPPCAQVGSTWEFLGKCWGFGLGELANCGRFLGKKIVHVQECNCGFLSCLQNQDFTNSA